MSKRVAIIGCKSTTRFLIESLAKHITIDFMVTIDRQLGEKNEVADYDDLSDLANVHQIGIYYAKNYSLKTEEDLGFFEKEKIDICFIVGWQRLIPENILQKLSVGAFGMHGSAMDLPLGRGRSPMNWAIIEGKKQFYTNLFKYDPGVDSGDVLDTFKFQITDRDTAETMHFKNSLAMVYLIKKNLNLLMSGLFVLQKQNSQITPTYYPKRNPQNSLINWNDDVTVIERFIRAVAPPFNGAYSFINGVGKIIIIESQTFDLSDFGYSNEKAGTIVQVFPNGKFLVKCFGGLLLVNHYKSESIPSINSVMTTGSEQLKFFERNHEGFFDLS